MNGRRADRSAAEATVNGDGGCGLLTSTLVIATRAQFLDASLAGELFHVADGGSDENHRLRLNP